MLAFGYGSNTDLHEAPAGMQDDECNLIYRQWSKYSKECIALYTWLCTWIASSTNKKSFSLFVNGILTNLVRCTNLEARKVDKQLEWFRIF